RENKTDQPEPERADPPFLVETIAEYFWEPERESGEIPEKHAGDDHRMEVRDQEQRIVELVIGGRLRKDDARDAAEREQHHESHVPEHWRSETDLAAIHREEPIEYLHAGGHRDNGGHDAEECVHVGTRAHREE